VPCSLFRVSSSVHLYEFEVNHLTLPPTPTDGVAHWIKATRHQFCTHIICSAATFKHRTIALCCFQKLSQASCFCSSHLGTDLDLPPLPSALCLGPGCSSHTVGVDCCTQTAELCGGKEGVNSRPSRKHRPEDFDAPLMRTLKP
jgi:hypothetical protein